MFPGVFQTTEMAARNSAPVSDTKMQYYFPASVKDSLDRFTRQTKRFYPLRYLMPVQKVIGL